MSNLVKIDVQKGAKLGQFEYIFLAHYLETLEELREKLGIDCR